MELIYWIAAGKYSREWHGYKEKLIQGDGKKEIYWSRNYAVVKKRKT
jgi:hypothetical protein